jgi:hypothetical protein
MLCYDGKAGSLMRTIATFASLLGIAVLAGCAHPITITPDLAAVSTSGVTLIKKNVGYYMAPEDKARQFTTAGGGGDKISHFPYRDLDAGIYKVLSNVFQNVSILKSATDTETIRKDTIIYVFVPEIVPSSLSDSLITWPPTSFTLLLTCTVYDAGGKVIGKKTVVGNGAATFDEFKADFSLAGRRASADALAKLQVLLSKDPDLSRGLATGVNPLD